MSLCDILIFGTSLDVIQRVKDYLSLNFDMKDFDHTDMILALKISRTPNEISLRKCDKSFISIKPISTPYDSSTALKKNTGELVSRILSINRFTFLYFLQD